MAQSRRRCPLRDYTQGLYSLLLASDNTGHNEVSVSLYKSLQNLCVGTAVAKLVYSTSDVQTTSTVTLAQSSYSKGRLLGQCHCKCYLHVTCAIPPSPPPASIGLTSSKSSKRTRGKRSSSRNQPTPITNTALIFPCPCVSRHSPAPSRCRAPSVSDS